MRALSVPWRALMLVTLLACPDAWAQSKPGLAITFEPSAVAASGLSPGRTVVWFGVERQVDAEYSSALFQHYQVGTVAADGTARQVTSAYGPTRARLNPRQPGARDGGWYLHGQDPVKGVTHNCLCYGTNTRLSYYFFDLSQSAPQTIPVAVNQSLEQP